VVTNSGMKLMYRHESGSPVHCIKARADLEAPIEVWNNGQPMPECRRLSA